MNTPNSQPESIAEQMKHPELLEMDLEWIAEQASQEVADRCRAVLRYPEIQDERLVTIANILWAKERMAHDDRILGRNTEMRFRETSAA